MFVHWPARADGKVYWRLRIMSVLGISQSGDGCAGPEITPLCLRHYIVLLLLLLNVTAFSSIKTWGLCRWKIGWRPVKCKTRIFESILPRLPHELNRFNISLEWLLVSLSNFLKFYYHEQKIKAELLSTPFLHYDIPSRLLVVVTMCECR